jgi:antitoxin component YwqK of YwqJK toxin-antitoxin module
MLVLGTVSFAQPYTNSEYERQGDRTKVTHYYEDGETIRETGFFYQGVSHGEWIQYSRSGEVQIEATYRDGKKEGTWFVYSPDRTELYEIVYVNNRMVKSSRWALEVPNLHVKN